MNLYRDKLNPETLKQAFLATAKKRGFTVSDEKSQVIINAVETDSSQQVLWASYQKNLTMQRTSIGRTLFQHYAN